MAVYSIYWNNVNWGFWMNGVSVKFEASMKYNSIMVYYDSLFGCKDWLPAHQFYAYFSLLINNVSLPLCTYIYAGLQKYIYSKNLLEIFLKEHSDFFFFFKIYLHYRFQHDLAMIVFLLWKIDPKKWWHYI